MSKNQNLPAKKPGFDAEPLISLISQNGHVETAAQLDETLAIFVDSLYYNENTDLRLFVEHYHFLRGMRNAIIQGYTYNKEVV